MIGSVFLVVRQLPQDREIALRHSNGCSLHRSTYRPSTARARLVRVVPLGRQPTAASSRTTAGIGVDSPNGACEEPIGSGDCLQPTHCPEGAHCFAPIRLVVRNRIFKAHCCEIVGRMSAVVITDFPQPAIVSGTPVQLVNEAQPLVSPVSRTCSK